MRIHLRLALLVALLLGASACTAGAPPTEPPTAAAPVIGEPATSESTAAPEAGTTDLAGRTILVGTDATYPPFEATTEAGEIVGIDPDLLGAVCEIANCVAKFQNTGWDGIFPALKAGDFDVLMSALTILPEREAESGAKFTDPYFEVGQVVLVKSDNTTISDVGGLKGADVKVGVQTGTTGDTAAVDGGVPDSSIGRYETIALAVQALLGGDVDAVVLDDPTADVYRTQHPNDLRVAGEPFTVEQYGILVPDDEAAVREAFNAALAQLKASGAVDDIVARWYANNQPTP